MAEVCTGAAHNDHPKEEAETPGDVVAGLDELDYDEFPEQSPGRGHSPAQGLDAEEGEVLSDEEEGEVLSDEEEEGDAPVITVTLAPDSNKHHSNSCSPAPPNQATPQRRSPSPQNRVKSTSLCRHFVQGRCSWGDSCRFVHELPPGHSHSRGSSPSSDCQGFPLHPLDMGPPPPLGPEMFPMMFPPPPPLPPPPPPHFPFPPFNFPPIPPPPHPYKRPEWEVGVVADREEDSGGWLRLRFGAREEQSSSPPNLSMKPLNSDDSNTESDNGKGHKKKKKKKKHKNIGHEQEWVDPWSRQKIKKEDPEEVKKKRKHKHSKQSGHSGSKKRKRLQEDDSP